MQHPDEGVIHTWLDGELPAEEAAALEAHIAGCSDCAALVAEARGLIAASSRIVSSLDIVPGDVIPAATPRKRPWYSNTQLRAAAAVVLVAGASLIVMRDQQVPEMETAMDRAVSADSPASQAEAPAAEPPQFSIEGKSGTARRSSPLMTVPAETRAQRNPAASSMMKSGTARQNEERPKQKFDARDESVAATEAKPSETANAARSSNQPERTPLEGKIAGVQAPTPAVAPPVADIQQRNLSRLRDSAVRYDPVVVTGVAAASGVARESMRETKLREVKSDTTGNVVVTIYELSPTVQVTLTETAPQALAPQRVETDQLKKEKSGSSRANVAQAPVASPMSPIALRTGAKIEVITWTNSSTGRVYTLSGPLSKEQLTALRKGLPADKG